MCVCVCVCERERERLEKKTFNDEDISHDLVNPRPRRLNSSNRLYCVCSRFSVFSWPTVP